MKMNLVSNENGSSVWHALSSRLDSDPPDHMKLAIAFVLESGVDLIRSHINRLIAAGKHVDLVFGDDFDISELRGLQKLATSGVCLRIYRGKRGFHIKSWMLESRHTKDVLIGSSNLSKPAMYAGSNVEAGVLLTDLSPTEYQPFSDLWDGIYSDSKEADESFLANYVEVEKRKSVTPQVNSSGEPDIDGNENELWDKFIKPWIELAASGDSEGGYLKWRGWYLLPEQGQLNDVSLERLSQVINAVERLGGGSGNTISIENNASGISNAASIIDQAGISYARPRRDSEKRNLFVRQQKNYLVALGFMHEPSQSIIGVTDYGYELGAALNAVERRQALTAALGRFHRWAVGTVRYLPFLEQLTESLPDQRIREDEFDLFVIHAYHDSEVVAVNTAIEMFRTLPEERRDELRDRAHTELSSTLDSTAGSGAFGHYLRKIDDLMVAFGNTSVLKVVSDRDGRRYLARR